MEILTEYEEIPDDLKEYFEPINIVRDVWQIATQPYPSAHYATFPEALVERCIKAGCPKEICMKCGKPRIPLIEKGEIQEHPARLNRTNDAKQFHADDNKYGEGGSLGRMRINKNLGLKPTCGCNAGFRPGIVLDPFAGSGTVQRVAERLGRKAIGLDLGYFDLQKKRTQGNQVVLPMMGG